MKKQYTAPSLTVVSINVEKGYAGSKFDFDVKLSKSSDTEFSESRSSSSNWTTSNDENFWNNTY